MPEEASREQAVIGLLDEWPWEPGTTLIGGYAVAAYGPARYSDDIDFVIPADALSSVQKWLTERGFVERPMRPAPNAAAFDDAIRLVRPPVTVDLLVGRVRDRVAQVDIPARWIGLRRRRVRLDLLSGQVKHPVQVARPEALWALKLQAGRDQDVTDLFAISREPVEAEEVNELFESLMCPSLATRLKDVQVRLGSRKLFDDSRSRLGLKNDRTSRDRWEHFCSLAGRMIPHQLAD